MWQVKDVLDRSPTNPFICKQCPPNSYSRVFKTMYAQPTSRLEICQIITCIDKQHFHIHTTLMHKGRKVFKACNVRLG